MGDGEAVRSEWPLSPSGRLFHSPGFNCYIIAVIGCKTSINPDAVKAGLEQTLLKHPRFSSKQGSLAPRPPLISFAVRSLSAPLPLPRIRSLRLSPLPLPRSSLTLRLSPPPSRCSVIVIVLNLAVALSQMDLTQSHTPNSETQLGSESSHTSNLIGSSVATTPSQSCPATPTESMETTGVDPRGLPPLPPLKKRKNSRESPVWQHYTKVVDENDAMNVRATCHYCKKDFPAHHKKNGTSGLKQHLESCVYYKRTLAGHVDVGQMLLNHDASRASSGDVGVMGVTHEETYRLDSEISTLTTEIEMD
ncbi:hypothetical protein CJ030_MR7G016686 [Morella rubra]|uniref:BED-type domain-containing protein n=1 Tax=Morella rubra TaxID=262757 RepID=A0A6A1UXE0_9ROSI|nr:hypothetical protein CJ030_MR7G016686 [Morella rubra]